MNETFAASAAKVTAVGTGAAYSMVANSGAIGAVAGLLAATYSAVQIFKALPWITDYIIALRNGVFRKDWSHWRSIARRTEKASDGNDSQS
jgi:hypothetical protein